MDHPPLTHKLAKALKEERDKYEYLVKITENDKYNSTFAHKT